MQSLQPDNLKLPYNIAYLKQSLIENNFAMPFFGWQNGEEVFVVDGHQRLQVLMELESEGVKIPELLDCQLIKAKDRKEAVKILLKVYNQRSNPIDLEVLTEWVNIEQVEVEVQSLNVVDINDVEDEIQEVLEAEEDDFDSTPPETPETVLGDLYEIGEHRLLCGDSTDSDQVAKLMDGSKADMVFTDPPYKIETEGSDKGDYAQSLRKHSANIEFISNFEPTEFLQVLPIVFGKNMNAYIFCNKELLPDYLLWARDSGYSFNVLIWKKPNAIPIGDSHRPDIEYLLLFRKSAIWNNGLKDVNYSRCLEFGRETGLHPTMKPIELIANEMKISSHENSLIFDFFLGSGSTMVAAHQLKRKCYGMELDCRYADVIVKRMIKLDSNLKIKRNGIDETKKWLDKIK
jgi:DNA modification methylase